MEEISITKEHQKEIERRDFELKHHVDTRQAQVARAIVEGNSKAIESCIRKGSFKEERFYEILQNNDLQTKYLQMAQALDRGNEEDFEPLYNDIKDKTDTFCGWLYFYNLLLENTLDLDLEPKSRLYYYLESLKEEG
jgi:hypothetical protein